MTRRTRHAVVSTTEAEIAYGTVVRRIYLLPAALLTKTETSLLLFLVHSASQGKDRFSATVLGEYLSLSSRTVRRTVQGLEGKEIIRVVRSMKTVRFNEVNRFEIDFNGPLGALDMSLNMPKSASKSVAKPETGVGHGRPTYNIITNDRKQIHKCITRESRQFDTIQNSVEAVAVRINRKRAEKVSKATVPGSQLTFAGVKAVWATAMLKHYPTVPALSFSAKDFAIFKMKVQPILASCSLMEFFDYLVSSWTTLRGTKFGFIRRQGKDIALAPSLPEVMRYWKIFAQSFLDSRMVDANNTNKLKPTEQDDADVAMRASKQQNVQLQRELATLKDRLTKAERIAYATRREEAPVLSLTAQRKKADDAYTPDDDLPDWSSHDKR